MIHISAVMFHVFVKRESLIKAMVTGKKPLVEPAGEELLSGKPVSEAQPGANLIQSSRGWLALVLVVVISAILAWIIVAAPEASLDLGY